GLIHFTIAQERPDLAAGGLLEAAVLQVLNETRVVDGLDRTQSHGNCRKLPELGHEQGMRIGAQPSAGLRFAAEIWQFLFRDAAFEIGAGVDSGSGVSLEVDDVSVATLSLRAKEMVEGNFIQR